MDLSRRGIFQLFGVGALVAPIINGVPEDRAVARLVEVPKVEIPKMVEGPPLSAFEENELVDITLYARVKSTGAVFSMHCHTAVCESISVKVPVCGIMERESLFRTLAPPEMRLRVKGYYFPRG